MSTRDSALVRLYGVLACENCLYRYTLSGLRDWYQFTCTARLDQS